MLGPDIVDGRPWTGEPLVLLPTLRQWKVWSEQMRKYPSPVGDTNQDWNAAVLPDVYCFTAGSVVSGIVVDASDTSFPVLWTLNE
jgi:hypothetical protein